MPVLRPGDPAPWFYAQASHLTSGHFSFHHQAGRRSLFFFFGSSEQPGVAQVLTDLAAAGPEWAELGVECYGIASDPLDATEGRPQAIAPQVSILWDLNYQIAAAYGVARLVFPEPAAPAEYVPQVILVDYNLCVIDRLLLRNPTGFVGALLGLLETLPPLEGLRSLSAQAPILRRPRVLDAATCAWLIAAYQEHGGSPSGYMKQNVGGETIGVMDSNFKRRKDWLIKDPQSWQRVHQDIQTRLFPAMKMAFHFQVQAVERYLVACYDAAEGGFFKPHRDNTTDATAHRRFAMSLNLNAGEFEGGQLSFPEFEHHGYSPATGEALVFSGSLLHEARPVTRGRRYVLLSFFS